MKNDKLNSVEIALSDYGLPVHRGVHSEGASFEYLSVILPPDLQGRPRQLIIRFSEVHIPAAKGEGAEPAVNQLLIHLSLTFPLSLPEESLLELGRLLHFYNKTLDLPGFGLDEIQRLLFFRYTLTSDPATINKRFLISIIGTIVLLSDSLSPQIEQVIKGASLVDVLKATVDASK